MIVERLRLDGRTVIVAGAGGGGIGLETTRACLEAGATVVAADHKDESLASTLELSDEIVPVIADVRDLDDVDRIVSTALDATGEIHGLVNVVGGNRGGYWGPAIDLDPAQWDELFDVNVRYLPFMCRAVARVMRDQGSGGSIVNMTSVSGTTIAPFHVSYGAAKAGVVSLTKTLAVEWGALGIRVNVIAPGTITTPRAGTSEVKDAAQAAIPLGRRGRSDEIAGAALFLLSDLASYVSGQCLTVDGAMSQKPASIGADNIPVFVTNPRAIAVMKGEDPDTAS